MKFAIFKTDGERVAVNPELVTDVAANETNDFCLITTMSGRTVGVEYGLEDTVEILQRATCNE